MSSRLAPMLLVLVSIFALPAQAREPALPKNPDKFTDFMATRFNEAIPGSKVKVVGTLRLDLTMPNGGHTIYLDNIWHACEGDRRRCRKSVDEFVANMAGVMKEGAAEIKPADIRAVVRMADYVAQARKAAEGRPERTPIARPVAGELWMVCVGDSPHGIRVLQHADLAKLGLTEEQTIALALKNTAAALPPLEADTHGVKHSGIKFAVGDFYESSRMLLHDSWAEMAKSMGGHLVVAVPDPDIIIYGNGTGNGDRAVLSAFAKTTLEKAPKPMTAALFEWTPSGWKVVAP